jgi:hypothetical protein
MFEVLLWYTDQYLDWINGNCLRFKKQYLYWRNIKSVAFLKKQIYGFLAAEFLSLPKGLPGSRLFHGSDMAAKLINIELLLANLLGAGIKTIKRNYPETGAVSSCFSGEGPLFPVIFC